MLKFISNCLFFLFIYLFENKKMQKIFKSINKMNHFVFFYYIYDLNSNELKQNALLKNCNIFSLSKLINAIYKI